MKNPAPIRNSLGVNLLYAQWYSDMFLLILLLLKYTAVQTRRYT